MLLANAVQGKAVFSFICLYCSRTHPPLAIEDRNTQWKSQGVYVRKEGMQEYTDRAVSIMSPVQQSAHFHACSYLVRGVVDAGSNLMCPLSLWAS